MTSSSSPSPTQVSPFAFRQLESRVVDSFQAPEDILSAVREEAERIREAARAEGEAAGRASALAAVQAETAGQLKALAGAAKALEEAEDQLVTALEPAVAELAIRLAEQILSGALQVQPERVVDVCRQALRRLAQRRQVTLIVNPEELDAVRGALAQLRDELGGIEQLDVQGDRRLGRGGAIARTGAVEIDATVQTQLERAREIAVCTLSRGADE
jgi:flagellar assembly protein FliH